MANYNPDRYFTLYPGSAASSSPREYEVEGRCRKTGTITWRIFHAVSAREARRAFEAAWPDSDCLRVQPAGLRPST